MNAGNRRELNKFRYNVSKIQRLSILLVSLGVVAGAFNGTGTEDRQLEATDRAAACAQSGSCLTGANGYVYTATERAFLRSASSARVRL